MTSEILGRVTFAGVFIGFGLWLILSRRKQAELIIREQNKWRWFNFGAREIAHTRGLAVVVGIAAILLGIWALVIDDFRWQNH